MKITCQNPSCCQQLNGPKSRLGIRTSCPTCGHSFIWTDCLHTGDDFVIYDLETTGLEPDYDEFIQIAAMRYRAGCLCSAETFFSYARPQRRISSFITDYTGISNAHVKDAPRPETVLEAFSRWAAQATLVAHNGKRFDSKFLVATCLRHQLPTREAQCIDSINLSKLLFGKTRGTGHSLDHLTSRLNLSVTDLRRHDARADVDILGRAVEKMARQLTLDHALNGVPRHATLLPRTS